MIKIKTFTAVTCLLLAPVLACGQDEEQTADPAVDSEAMGTEAMGTETMGPEAMGPEFRDPGEQSVPVADEPAVADELRGTAVDPDATDEQRLQAAFTRYRKLINEGTLDEADTVAKQIVELAIKVYGPQSRETANALNNLGIVQHGNGQFDAAIQNFTSSVEIIEAVEDRLNAALVNPLKGLGAAQLSKGRPDQAKKTFTRAAHITQVNEGPHNLDQVEILESIAETYIRMGEAKEAREILDRIHIINVKHFEKNPLGLLPSLMSRAEWQHRAGYYTDERTTYRRAIRIIEASAGKNDPLLVEPLRRLGETFYYVDTTMSSPQYQGLISTGELYFKRAASIAEKSEDMDWRERSYATLALADYYTAIESQNRSRKMYLQVWNMLEDDVEKITQREAWFNDPVPLRPNQLPTYAGGDPPTGAAPGELITGRIVVDYSVSTRGRVNNIRTEAFPEEFVTMQKMVHREVRARVHRPRVVDGVPVDAEGLRYEHEFTYFQTDLEALRKTAADAAIAAEK